MAGVTSRALQSSGAELVATNVAGRHVFWGSLLPVLGYVIAIIVLPHDTSDSLGVAIASFLYSLFLLAYPIARLDRSPVSWMRAENIVTVSIIYWILIDVLQMAYPLPFDYELVVKLYGLITLFVVGMWVGCYGIPVRAPRFLVNETMGVEPGTLAVVIILAGTLGISDFVYRADFDIDQIIDGLTAPRFETPWQREFLGDWSAFSYHLQYFGYLVPSVTVVAIYRLGFRNPVVWLGLAFSLLILTFHAQSGGRRIVGGIVLAALVCWLLSARQLSPAKMMGAFLAAFGLLGLMQAMLLVRNMGLVGEYRLDTYDYLHVDDNFLRLGQTLEIFPEAHPFVGWNMVIYALIRPIPRVLWPDKPVDPGFSIADELGVPNTSYSITAIGEGYVTAGVATVAVYGLAFGLLAGVINSTMRGARGIVNPIVPAVMIMTIFIGMRSIIELVLMSYVLVAWLILRHLYGTWRAMATKAK